VAGEPSQPIEPAGGGEGTTWVVILAYYAGDNIDGLQPAHRIDGVRVPGLARHLLGAPVDYGQEPGDVVQVSALLQSGLARLPREAAAFLTAVRESPGDEASWLAFTDWLEEHNEPPPGQYLLRRAFEQAEPGLYRRPHDRSRDLIRVEEHLAQLCLFADRTTG